MKVVRSIAAIAVVALIALVIATTSRTRVVPATPVPDRKTTAAGQLTAPSGWRTSPGLGGAGAFVPPAHVNGVFGAGGPCAGLGGAGAFIPPTLPPACRTATSQPTDG